MLSADLLLIISDLVRGCNLNSSPALAEVKNGYILYQPAGGHIFASSSSSLLSSSQNATNAVRININSSLSAVLLAAQCLTALEQYEDSILLLESLICIDSEENMKSATEACRNIKFVSSINNTDPSNNTNSSSDLDLNSFINPLAGESSFYSLCI